MIVTSYARIRRAALTLFADRGVAATSIRMIADAAQVSPGVVQHYFRSKERLRAAVDELTRLYVADAFAYLPADMDRTMLRELLDVFVEDNPYPLRYLARGVADGEPGTIRVFEVCVDIAARFLPRDSARGLVIRILGSALLEPALGR